MHICCAKLTYLKRSFAAGICLGKCAIKVQRIPRSGSFGVGVIIQYIFFTPGDYSIMHYSHLPFDILYPV